MTGRSPLGPPRPSGLRTSFRVAAAVTALALSGCESAKGPTAVAEVVSLTVTGQTQDDMRFTAMATFSDGTRLDVTAEAAWSSSDESVVTVSIGGLASVVGGGSANVCATYRDVAGCTTIAVIREPDDPPTPTPTSLRSPG